MITLAHRMLQIQMCRMVQIKEKSQRSKSIQFNLPMGTAAPPPSSILMKIHCLHVTITSNFQPFQLKSISMYDFSIRIWSICLCLHLQSIFFITVLFCIVKHYDFMRTQMIL